MLLCYNKDLIVENSNLPDFTARFLHIEEKVPGTVQV
jgi:hypothetical protein